jgi:hypothetical protein
MKYFVKFLVSTSDENFDENGICNTCMDISEKEFNQKDFASIFELAGMIIFRKIVEINSEKK